MSALSDSGSLLNHLRSALRCAAVLAAAVLVCGCLTAAGGARAGPGARPAPGAEAVERLRLAVMDARSAAEEAGADSSFPELYSSIQARFNASMDAEGEGALEPAAEGYRDCRSLFGTLARLADASNLRDELAAKGRPGIDEAAWQAAERSLAAALRAFLADDRGAARSADEALALFSRLGGLTP